MNINKVKALGLQKKIFKIINLHKQDLLFFSLLSIVVTFLNFVILSPAQKLGLHHDDWKVLIWYKGLGSRPLATIPKIIGNGGTSLIYKLFHIGILDSLFGLDFLAFHNVNILLKIFSNLTLFLMVLVVFRSKLLAFLTALIFAIGYTSSATLQWVLLGGDYLGLGMMNLFFVAYYHFFKRKTFDLKLGILTLALFISAIGFSIIRLYPLLFLPLVIELSSVVLQGHKRNLFLTIKRILSIYWPFLIILFIHPSFFADFSMFKNTLFIDLIRKGDWQPLVNLFSGLGITVVPNSISTKVFGVPPIKNFSDYFFYLLKTPLIFFGFLTLPISYYFKGKKLKTFISILFLNFLLELILFPLFTNNQPPSPGENLIFNGLLPYSTFIGVFIFAISIINFSKWIRQDKKNSLLFALWIGPFISFFFIFLISWLNTTTFSSVHRYLMIPSAGTSLFTAAIILLLNRVLVKMLIQLFSCLCNLFIKSQFLHKSTISALRIIFNNLCRFFGGIKISFPRDFVDVIKKRLVFISSNIFLLTLFILMFIINASEINHFYDYKIQNGYGAYENELLHQQMEVFLDKYKVDIKNPSLFYFDQSEVGNLGEFYEQGFVSDFIYWMHLKKNQLITGCVGIFPGGKGIENFKKQTLVIDKKTNQKFFRHYGLCVDFDQGFNKSSNKMMLYKPENLYAFRFEGREIVDIRKEMFEKLNIALPADY